MNELTLPTAPEPGQVLIRDYLNVLLRRRMTFAITSLAIVAAVILYTSLQPPLYESTTTLYVKGDKGRVLSQMDELLLKNAAPVDSEVEIIKSRTNVERVVSKLHLDWKLDKDSNAVIVQPVEFVSAAKEPVYTVKLLGGGSYEVTDYRGTPMGKGVSGVRWDGRDVTILLQDVSGPRGGSFRLTQLPFNSTVENLRKSIKVTEVGRKTNLISVSYRDSDAVRARDVVNTLVETYLEHGVATKTEEAIRTIQFVEEQLQNVKSELEAAENNLQSYKSASGVVQLEAEAENAIAAVRDVEKQKADVVLQRKHAEFALASLKGARKGGTTYSPALLRDDPVVTGMASRLAELELQKTGLLSETTESHPNVGTAQVQIEEIYQKLERTMENVVLSMVNQEGSLSREISKRDSQLKRLPVAERELARLTRLSKVNADIYTFLLQKHEEARIAQASTISNILIIDPAITADHPVLPKKHKNLLLGSLVGLLAGVALSFLKEALDDTVKGPDEAKKELGLPLLGVIPFISGEDGRRAMVSQDAPTSSASEAFRSLRTALHFFAVNKKAILVTSALPGEGKSTVASNLAISLAQAGSRVLVIDCDLRRSTLHSKLGAGVSPGLTEYLAGDVSVTAVVQPTAIEGLDLVQAGAAVPPNPAELLGSARMNRLMDHVRPLYGYIIMDAPPVLAVTDAHVLTGVADLVLVVLEAGKVPTRAVRLTRETLQTLSAPLGGIVITDRRCDGSGYGYGYRYRCGYSDGATGAKRWWKLGPADRQR